MHEPGGQEVNDLLTQCVEKYGPDVFRTIRRRGVQAADAEILMQDVWMEVRKHFFDHGMELPPHFEATLKRIAANKAVDHVRRQGAYGRRWNRLLRSGIVRDCCDSTADGDQEKMEQTRQKKMEALRAALESLDPSLRDIVEWHFWGGLSNLDIAAHLKVHFNTVGRRYLRALDQLRKKLEEHGIESLS